MPYATDFERDINKKIRNFSPKHLKVYLNGAQCLNFAEDTFVEIATDDDMVTMTKDIAGGGTYNISTSTSGTISMTFVADSPEIGSIIKTAMSIQSTGLGFFNVTVTDENPDGFGMEVYCPKAQLQKIPDISYGKEMGYLTVTFLCMQLNMTNGEKPLVPVTI